MFHKKIFLTQQDENKTIVRSNYIKSQQFRNPKFFLKEVQSPIAKRKKIIFLYDEIKMKLQNDLKKNLSNQSNLLKQRHQTNGNEKFIAEFKLKISKSIEKYIEKQNDQSVLKIKSYQDYLDGESNILTPKNMLLKARSSKFIETKSNKKLSKVVSCHEQLNPYLAQTQNTNMQSTRYQEQVVSRYFLRPQLSKR